MERRDWIKVLVLWMSTLLPVSGLSQEVPGVYDVRTIVVNKSAEERRLATLNSFREVLVRVSGQRSVLEAPALAKALADPQRYLLEFSYEAISQDPDSGRRAVQRLKLRYDKVSIEKLLRSNGLPLWGDQRSALLVWWAEEESGGQRNFVSGDMTPELVAAFSMVGDKRGQPLTFPLLDIADTDRLSASEVWGGFYDRVVTASRRYGVQAVLAGRHQRVQGIWKSRYALLFEGQVIIGSQQADSEHDVIRVTLHDAIDALARHQATTDINDSVSGEFFLQVRDVNTYQDYSAVLDYLQGLAGIRTVTIDKVEGSVLWATLHIRGSSQSVLKEIKSGGRMRAHQQRYIHQAREEGADGDDLVGVEGATNPSKEVNQLVGGEVSAGRVRPARLEHVFSWQ